MSQTSIFEEHAEQACSADLSHYTRDELERLYALTVARLALAESRVAQAELRAARAESDLGRLTRAQAAAARRRALIAAGQQELNP